MRFCNVHKLVLVARILFAQYVIASVQWQNHQVIAFQYSSLERSGNEQLANITDIINSILVGYDIRLRPDFGLDPLKITMDIAIASFDSISEVNMDFTITLYLNQHWRDKRLSFGQNPNHELTLSGDFADRIWVPDTFFANDKHSFLHEVTEKNKMIRLRSNGEVSYGMRFTSTLACMMDLHYYPLDLQRCSVEIESYGYTVSEVVMTWSDTPVLGMQDAKLPQFTIVNHETSNRRVRLATGVYQRLRLSFDLKREIGYFIFQTYLPSILIVMLSWVSFWINHEATSARVALGITTVLTMTTISTGVRSSLPRISYIKAIDIYLVMCFVFVFAALLEYAAVNYSYWGARAKKKRQKSTRCDSGNGKLGTGETSFEMRRLRRVSPSNSNAGRLRRRHHRPSVRSAATDRRLASASHWALPPNDSIDANMNFGDSFNRLTNNALEMNGIALDPSITNPSLYGFSAFDSSVAAVPPASHMQMSHPLESMPIDMQLDPRSIQLLQQLAGNNAVNLPAGSTSLDFASYSSLANPTSGTFDSSSSSLANQMRISRSLMADLDRMHGPDSSNQLELLLQKRLNLLQALKRMSKWTRIKDVNKIDKYSRLVFPVAYLIFNIIYWTFYTL